MCPATALPAAVPEAFAAGWQIAELFHGTIPHQPPSHQGIPDHLPGLSRLSSYQIALLHLDQVDRALTHLLGDTRGPSGDASTSVRRALTSSPIHGDQVRSAVAALHTYALSELTIADFRLGKAYGLGRALAETALLPPAAPDLDKAKCYHHELGSGRLGNIHEWLADLKTALPDHSAYAVSWSLQQWEDWVRGASDATLVAADSFLRRQGQQWRAILSGERAGEDFLGTIDLMNAAKELGSRFGRTIGAFLLRYKGIVTLAVAVLLGIVGGVLAGAVVTGDTKILWGGLTALVGAVGGWKALSATLGKGIRSVEDSLWQSELDGAIANRTLVLPAIVPGPTENPKELGRLSADTVYPLVATATASSPSPVVNNH